MLKAYFDVVWLAVKTFVFMRNFSQLKLDLDCLHDVLCREGTLFMVVLIFIFQESEKKT